MSNATPAATVAARRAPASTSTQTLVTGSEETVLSTQTSAFAGSSAMPKRIGRSQGIGVAATASAPAQTVGAKRSESGTFAAGATTEKAPNAGTVSATVAVWQTRVSEIASSEDRRSERNATRTAGGRRRGAAGAPAITRTTCFA